MRLPKNLKPCVAMALAIITVGATAAMPSGQDGLPASRALPGVVVRDHLGGDGQMFEIDSRLLSETRRVQVALPASHAMTTRPYPVIVVLDGESLFGAAVAMSAALTASGQMPESIVIGLPNTQRLRDLTPPGLSVSGSSLTEGGDRFLDFIEQELLPVVAARFRGAGPVVLIGHSSGGVLATYAAATRPAFRLVLALDTPVHLGDGWLANRLVARAEGRSPGALRYVSLSAKFGWPEAVWARLTDAAPASWQTSRRHLDRESHESMTVPGIYFGLQDLFADYSAITAPASPTTRTLDHYSGLDAAYGSHVVPPRALLVRLIDDLLLEHRAAEARTVRDWLVDGYGPPPNLEALDARIADVAASPAPTETVEGLLATPPPTASKGQPYVGRWEGTSWVQPEAPSFLALDVRIVDNHLVADVISRPAPGVEHVQPATYLKVDELDDGTPALEFGYLNGMRPRGVLLYQGLRNGDILRGTMRLGGMTFTMPNGRPLPVTHFELRRAR